MEVTRCNGCPGIRRLWRSDIPIQQRLKEGGVTPATHLIDRRVRAASKPD